MIAKKCLGSSYPAKEELISGNACMMYMIMAYIVVVIIVCIITMVFTSYRQ